MSNEVKVIFESNSAIAENEAVKNFVKNSPTGHCSVLLNDEHYVVVKNDEKTPVSLEKVRATAGNIARDLGSRKVETAFVAAEDIELALQN